MTDWPTSMVREIAARRCVIFIGSGVSASSQNSNGSRTKTWSEFLMEACSLVSDSDHRAEIEELINQGNFLLALEGIKQVSDNGDFRSLLDNSFNDHNLGPNDLHRIILELDSRIVVTTNFDKLYEKYCNSTANVAGAFKVISYTSTDLCDELKSDARLIIKAHGSIDEVSKMIFTRSEYHRARANNHNFYEILKALFLTNTVIFIGCGMADPDMQLVLEEVNIVGASSRPHYVVTMDETITKVVKDDWKNTYNIVPITYGPTHAELPNLLESLVEKVLEERASSGIA